MSKNIKISTCLVSIALIILISACKPSRPSYQGYVEGRYHYIASNHAGILKQLLVHAGDSVKQGQLLFLLDKSPEDTDVMQAQANINQAQAQINQVTALIGLDQLIYQRQQALRLKKAIDQQSVDIAKSHLLQAQAELSANNAKLITAKAGLKKAQWSYQQKFMTSSVDAQVFDTYYLNGEQVPAGHPVLSLLSPQEIKLIFFVPADILPKLSIGNTVIDYTYPSNTEKKSAIICYISPAPEYTPPVIYSDKTTDKLLYKIEASPTGFDAVHLHPGQPLMITLNIHDK